MKPPEFTGKTFSSVPLSKYTTWKVGGPADWLFIPDTLPALQTVIRWINRHNLSRIVLGNGSNILFSDYGFRGAVILLGKAFNAIQIHESSIFSGAGVMLSQLARQAADAGLSGMEALAGIPGTVGGAGYVNAGAHGQSIMALCQSAQGVTGDSEIENKTDFHWGYRSGGFPDDFIITGLHLALQAGNPMEIHQLSNQYLERRRSTQPVSEASAGCTFKNPEGTGAGRLIDELGLKGFQIGRAMISTKHANFIINSGGASASEIIELMRHVKDRVRSRYGVTLIPEVVIVSKDGRRINLEDYPE